MLKSGAGLAYFVLTLAGREFAWWLVPVMDGGGVDAAEADDWERMSSIDDEALSGDSGWRCVCEDEKVEESTVEGVEVEAGESERDGSGV